MRRRIAVIITIAAASLIVIGAAMAFMFMRREPEWTTSSEAALREFNLGLTAERKFYTAEAREHYERALKLDPNFVFAQIEVLDSTLRGPERLEKLKRVVDNADLSKLNKREQFIIRHVRANLARDTAAANRILEQYVRENPDDPVGVNRLCGREWERKNWPEAEKCYRRLLELDPNWVSAQNNLGYIAMAQGRFKEAEELFKMYRFIAPDQANPHDSLGELLTVTGRYDEAEKALSQALAMRSDFCASYDHLLTISLLREDFDKAESILDRTERAGCDAQQVQGMSCGYETFRAYDEGRFSDVVDVAKANDCYKRSPPVLMLSFAAALASGREADADFLENGYREERKKAFTPYNPSEKDPALLHLEGVRLAVNGKYRPAAAKFREADEQLVYWGDGQGVFKVYNQMLLARVLEKGGQRTEARQVQAHIESVNPQIDRTMKRFVF